MKLSRLETAGVVVCVLLLGLALALTAPDSRSVPVKPKGSPWTGQGIWVWYLKETPDSLAARLKASGVRTVFIKSADGTRIWSQLSKGLTDTLHGQGIHVCGWQYAYGRYPTSEARAAAKGLKTSGADCFVIDAEEEYKGRSRSARVYLRELRSRMGSSFRLGFTSFPYVKLHQELPYKIFLGPGGAEANLPQMYWKEIQKSPRRVVRETYKQNLALGRPVYPIGQTYHSPPLYELSRFVQEVKIQRAKGFSWWSLDHSRPEHLRRLTSFKEAG